MKKLKDIELVRRPVVVWQRFLAVPEVDGYLVQDHRAVDNLIKEFKEQEEAEQEQTPASGLLNKPIILWLFYKKSPTCLKAVLRAKWLGIHRKWRYTYTNYDVISMPTMM